MPTPTQCIVAGVTRRPSTAIMAPSYRYINTSYDSLRAWTPGLALVAITIVIGAAPERRPIRNNRGIKIGAKSGITGSLR